MTVRCRRAAVGSARQRIETGTGEIADTGTFGRIIPRLVIIGARIAVGGCDARMYACLVKSSWRR